MLTGKSALLLILCTAACSGSRGSGAAPADTVQVVPLKGGAAYVIHPTTNSTLLVLEPRVAVKQLDPLHYEVGRSVVDEMLEQPARARGIVRVVGDPRGVVLEEVAQTSFAARLGFRDGDVITAVNEIAVAGILGDDELAIELIDELAAASAVTVEVVRGGKAARLEYFIR